MAPHKPFDPHDHIPSNWGMAPSPKNEFRTRSRALMWVALGLSLPIVAAVCFVVFSRTDTIQVQRDSNAFEKNLKPSAPSSPDAPLKAADPAAPNEEPPNGMVKMNYSTENVKMDLYRKDGFAVVEKKKKKDDFLGNPLNDSGSTDVEDRAKGPGGPDK